MFEYDVCIIGTGRVGLPLGLSFSDQGLHVLGIDVDPALRQAVNQGRMPFHEPGFEDIVARRTFQVYEDASLIRRAKSLVVTVGTPLHQHVESDLRHIQRVLEQIAPHLVTGQLICLRSTIAPGTTAYVRAWLERNTSLRVGRDLMLAFCPERIAEGKAFDELRSLPQIIGSEDGLSRAAAGALFTTLAPEVFHTDYISAELVKLFNNVERYVHFALANQFALVADTYGADIYQIRHMTNYKYPRNHLAKPGLTAGTCLRKDFGMISEWNPYPDLMVAAWKMNEYMPAFLVQHMKKRMPLRDKRVALLGYAFKEETDDFRDSLAPKLLRYVLRELPHEVSVSDTYLPDPIADPVNGPLRNVAPEVALCEADCVFVATAHRCYRQVLTTLGQQAPEVWIADIWNLGGLDRIFYQARDLSGVALQEAV